MNSWRDPDIKFFWSPPNLQNKSRPKLVIIHLKGQKMTDLITILIIKIFHQHVINKIGRNAEFSIIQSFSENSRQKIKTNPKTDILCETTEDEHFSSHCNQDSKKQLNACEWLEQSEKSLTADKSVYYPGNVINIFQGFVNDTHNEHDVCEQYKYKLYKGYNCGRDNHQILDSDICVKTMDKDEILNRNDTPDLIPLSQVSTDSDTDLCETSSSVVTVSYAKVREVLDERIIGTIGQFNGRKLVNPTVGENFVLRVFAPQLNRHITMSGQATYSSMTGQRCAPAGRARDVIVRCSSVCS